MHDDGAFVKINCALDYKAKRYTTQRRAETVECLRVIFIVLQGGL